MMYAVRTPRSLLARPLPSRRDRDRPWRRSCLQGPSHRTLLVVLQNRDVAQPRVTEDRVVGDALDIWLDDEDEILVEERDHRGFLDEQHFGLFVLRGPRFLITHHRGLA